jgi:hypothetical protein
MLNGAETIHCEISSSAMDDLTGRVSGSPAGREAQFLSVPGEIERVASAIFDDGPVVGMVRIFAKGLDQRRPRRSTPSTGE